MQELRHTHRTDDEGNITGGLVEGIGLSVLWQDGPIQDGLQNGALIADLLAAARDRLRVYQATQLSCRENALAITHIEEAMHWLEARQRDRFDRGVSGTYQA